MAPVSSFLTSQLESQPCNEMCSKWDDITPVNPTEITPEIASLMIRAYQPSVSLNEALLNPYYFWGGTLGGGSSWLPFVKFGVYIPSGQAKQRAVSIQESQVEIEEFGDTWRAHHPYLITSSFIITTTTTIIIIIIIIIIFFNHSFLPSLLHSFSHSFIHPGSSSNHHLRITCFISHPATPIPFIQKESSITRYAAGRNDRPGQRNQLLELGFWRRRWDLSGKHSATAKQGFCFSAFRVTTLKIGNEEFIEDGGEQCITKLIEN